MPNAQGKKLVRVVIRPAVSSVIGALGCGFTTFVLRVSVLFW